MRLRGKLTYGIYDIEYHNSKIMKGLIEYTYTPNVKRVLKYATYAAIIALIASFPEIKPYMKPRLSLSYD